MLIALFSLSVSTVHKYMFHLGAYVKPNYHTAIWTIRLGYECLKSTSWIRRLFLDKMYQLSYTRVKHSKRASFLPILAYCDAPRRAAPRLAVGADVDIVFGVAIRWSRSLDPALDIGIIASDCICRRRSVVTRSGGQPGFGLVATEEVEGSSVSWRAGLAARLGYLPCPQGSTQLL